MEGAAHERRVVRFLSDPRHYPHPVGRVVHRETHISHVFLAGRFAYKLKKPVTFPFLDASTLALRRRWCRAEVALNRRLAPWLYLGMAPIIQTREGLRLTGQGRVVEWVVKMHRLPEDRLLDRMVAGRRVRRRDVERTVDRLILFFRRAARTQAIASFGTPARVERLVFTNLEECRPFVGRLLAASDRSLLAGAFRQFLTLHEPLLRRRVAEGRVIDGHGDLRCENICLTEPVTIFDCVEFEPAFRRGDIAGDLGFLAMDLEFRGRRDLAEAVVARYQRRTHDATCRMVLPFYQCHRSLVRGKVRGLMGRQAGDTPRGRRMRRLAKRHFQLALRYARIMAPPKLVVVGGLIGTGKSTVARELAAALGAAWLRTDEIRRREFRRHRRTGQGFAEGLYAPSVTERVYRRLSRRADVLLREGRSVVCDGTFARARWRQRLRGIARRRGASFHVVECTVPRAVAMRRVAGRDATRADLSEARPEFYDRLRAGFEPPQRGERRQWMRLATNRPRRLTSQAALRTLRVRDGHIDQSV